MSSKLFTLSVVLFLAVAFGMFLFIDSLKGEYSEITGLIVTSESFPTYLKTHPITSLLPNSASVGIKIGDSSYEINGRDVKHSENLDNKDIMVYLPENYEAVIGELGICGAIKKANNDKNIRVEVFSSKSKLLLKYGKLLKFSSCVS